MMTLIISRARRFRRDDEGVALVEFALLLPLMLLSFFTIVEFSRVFFSYQGAIAGVRDATRYMARTYDGDVCEAFTTPQTSAWVESPAPPDGTTTYNYYTIVRNNMDTEVPGLLPANVTLDLVQSRFHCEESSEASEPYRQALVPMAEIEASFTVQLPLVGILELNGRPLMDPITHTVGDITRIYGF